VSGQWKKLRRDDLAAFLDELAARAELWVPTKPANRWEFARYETGQKVQFAPSIIETSAKALFFPQRRPIARFNPKEKWSLEPVELPTAPRVVMGLHPCDVAALERTDRVLGTGERADRLYKAERERTTIVGMRCSEMKPTCHCTDRSLSPDETAGMDAVFAEVADGWIFRSLTDKGAKLIESKLLQPTGEQPAVKEWPNGNYPVPGPDELLALYEDDFWLEASDICLTCGACTFACPTCTCYLVADEKSGDQGERVTAWDSCQFLSYSRETSGNNPRKTNAARLRNRTLEKFAYSYHKTGIGSCIGCGRCVIICPIRRSFPQLGKELKARVEERKAAAK
jgi:sulfhydrogenase subunit beta (sulfur reductase)